MAKQKQIRNKLKSKATYGSKSFSVPTIIQTEMAKHPEINWSTIVQNAICKELGVKLVIAEPILEKI